MNVTTVVRIDNRQNPLEIDFPLLVLSHGVAQGDETGFEFIGSQSTGARFVKVVEGSTEFVQLLLCDALEKDVNPLKRKLKRLIFKRIQIKDVKDGTSLVPH